MKNKLAIFDLDGTLFDTRRVNYLSYNKALQEYGEGIGYEYFSQKCNGRHYSEFLPQILGGEQNIDKIHRKKKRYYNEFLHECRENVHLFQILSCMKSKYYIALVTTASRMNCEELLNYFHRFELFDLIITQEDVEQKKPDPEGFLKAMEYFGIENSQAVVFEDSDVGVEAAERSGATVFVIKGFA